MIVNNVRQALLNSFNKANNLKTPIAITDVSWTNPEVWLQGQCNSRVTITALTDSPNYTGTQTLYFTRRRISEDLREVKIPGKPSDYTTFFQVINALREKLGVPLQEAEFLDRPVSGSTVTIATTVACMGFLPSDNITLEYAET